MCAVFPVFICCELRNPFCFCYVLKAICLKLWRLGLYPVHFAGTFVAVHLWCGGFFFFCELLTPIFDCSMILCVLGICFVVVLNFLLVPDIPHFDVKCGRHPRTYLCLILFYVGWIRALQRSCSKELFECLDWRMTLGACSWYWWPRFGPLDYDLMVIFFGSNLNRFWFMYLPLIHGGFVLHVLPHWFLLPFVVLHVCRLVMIAEGNHHAWCWVDSWEFCRAPLIRSCSYLLFGLYFCCVRVGIARASCYMGSSFPLFPVECFLHVCLLVMSAEGIHTWCSA